MQQILYPRSLEQLARAYIPAQIPQLPKHTRRKISRHTTPPSIIRSRNLIR